ncbi:superfamily II DNA/RNA helicase [Brevibacterium sanguinis]|uniref:Superfamily II DNA/RNA helicase n=3 Tax=Brevibacteriaceae TaxID=85019 RepID=A0A366IR31_9MICO|nr:superfamily II DNA/RNA helicase [Brevibacterium sanguinis]RBP74577.1 superfamily II DNA/RNA helicase [Brevibacterium celere]
MAFPIQQDTLPDTLSGRDVLGRGKTGSGKTLAFAIPMVARLAASQTGPRRPRLPRGLILAPTRELATQITNVLDPLAQACGMRTTTIFGGVNQKRQETALNAGVDIVVACPGRLEDLLQQGLVSLDRIEVTVLDEADHMADLGFLPGVTRILAKTPETGQRMFFSATLDNDVSKLVRRFLHDEVLHSVDDPTSHVSDMTHSVFEVSEDDKNELVHRLASGTGRRILFTRTKHRAKRFARQLTAQGIPAADLHGNLSQGARDRNLAAFSAGDVRVLVATDVAARGVHVDSVELVVHVDPPTEHKAYLHRSGRTARAGSSGDVVTIMVPEQRKDTLALLRRAAIKATPQKVTAESAAVSELVGDIAPFVAPQPKESPRSSSRPTAERSSGQRAPGGRSSRRRGGRGGGSARSAEANRDSAAHAGASRQGGQSRGASAGGSRQGGQSRGASAGGSRQGGQGRGTSAETRGRHRSRRGAQGSQQVWSTSS